MPGKIAAQMERFDARRRFLDSTLRQAPEILKAVRNDAAPHVFNGVVNHLMHIGRIQIIVGRKRICLHGGTSSGVSSDQTIKSF